MDVEEVIAIIGEAGRLEVDDLGAAIEELVNDFAVVGLCWVVAQQGVCTSSRFDAVFAQLHPWVGETILCAKAGANGCVFSARVAAIGVANDDDSVSARPSVNVVGNLLYVGLASLEIIRLVTVEKEGSAQAFT